jgi:translocator protein
MLSSQLAKTIVSVVVCFLVVGLVGTSSSYANAKDWYNALNRQTFTPPDWLFAPVWTVLYVMMGVAASLVWQRGLGSAGVKVALAAFAIQLILNAIWSPLFFGMHSLALALMDIAALWLAIIVTIILFWHVSRPASLLLVPYILWVTFAAFLNFRIWQMNP